MCFSSDEEVNKAIELSGVKIGGWYIVIEKSKGKKEREIPKVENLSEECWTIFIWNLPYEITEDEIGDRF